MKVEDIWRMRKLLPLLLLLCAAPLLGQDVQTGDSKTETAITKNWSHFAGPTEGPRGFTLQSRDMRQNATGQYELWLKIIPSNREAFSRRYGVTKTAAYVLQYSTVDCAKKLLMFEKTTVYNSNDAIVKSESSTLSANTNRDRVKPGSIGSAVFEKVCGQL